MLAAGGALGKTGCALFVPPERGVHRGVQRCSKEVPHHCRSNPKCPNTPKASVPPRAAGEAPRLRDPQLPSFGPDTPEAGDLFLQPQLSLGTASPTPPRGQERRRRARPPAPGGTGPGRGAPLRGAERRGPRVSGSTWRGRPGSWGPASSVEGPRRQRRPAGWRPVHHASLPVPPCLQPGPGPRLRPPRWGLCFTRPHRVGPTSSPGSRGPNPLTPRKTPAWMFSRIRFGVTDLGMTITFLWM